MLPPGLTPAERTHPCPVLKTKSFSHDQSTKGLSRNKIMIGASYPCVTLETTHPRPLQNLKINKKQKLNHIAKCHSFRFIFGHGIVTESKDIIKKVGCK